MIHAYRICALLVTILCLRVGIVKSQQKFSVTKSQIAFTSNAQLELIKASSDKVQGIIDPTNNQFVFSVPVQTFRGFNSDLQRQHFNDNYMESAEFPKATFSGKIIEQINFDRDTTCTVRAKGDLDVHGQKQNRIIKSKLNISKGTITIESDFLVPLSDHNISIPKIVNQKIATQIEVVFRASLTRQ